MLWKEFLIGGTTVVAISYFGNSVDPLLAGLLGGIPLALPSLYFVTGEQNVKAVSTTLLFSTFLLFLTVVTFYALHYSKKVVIPKNRALVISMSVWLAVTLCLWKTKAPLMAKFT